MTQAQESLTSASITGRILDPSGAAVAQARITALQEATSQSYTTRSDSEGRFRFSFLPVGQYEIRASAAGFQDSVQRVQLTVGAAFDLSLPLAVSQATVNVRVSDTPPVIETDRSQIGETIDQEEATNLPYEGRNYLDLALLMPGVSPTNTASTQTLAETSEVVGQGYSVNSQRNFSNSFIVDGLSANDDAAGVAGNVFGMDAVSEFQVVTSGGQAEFGRAMGGYFNLITKSGTNSLHGTAYGFLRNQRLNADNALSGSKLPLTQGQYGVSLGGPIRRNRTFAFGNFEE
ncbi:MAG TPA: carboxypeptidase regulatory-like domain-containing protein, partial [Bryobacteraceae bacterium]|nr:carboxypeptidase regulatory-like domain-containing protein [Bryobacteraceae bacterium]